MQAQLEAEAAAQREHEETQKKARVEAYKERKRYEKQVHAISVYNNSCSNVVIRFK